MIKYNIKIENFQGKNKSANFENVKRFEEVLHNLFRIGFFSPILLNVIY